MTLFAHFHMISSVQFDLLLEDVLIKISKAEGKNLTKKRNMNKIFIVTFFCCFTLTLAGISDYLQLIKLLTTDTKPPAGVRTVEEYNRKIQDGESAVLDFLGIVGQFNGYIAAEYKVTTNDGYILTLHRITASPKSPEKAGKPPVYLLNGLGETSELYVLFGPKQALTFQLADAGYDVWIGNVRGTTHSKKHVTLNSTDNKYWDFSLDEIAKYDVSKCIDFILKETEKDTLTIIGYSMGSTLIYMLLVEETIYNDKVNLLVNMAPVTFFLPPSNKMLEIVLSTILWLHSMSMKIIKTKRTYEVLPQSTILENFGRISCSGTGFGGCKQIIKLLADVDNIDPVMLPRLLSYMPAGMSYNTLRHYQQLIKSKGQFQKYDYSCGRLDYTCPKTNTTNLKKYKQSIPPRYDLSRVNVNNAIFYSAQDETAVPKDVKYLINKLRNVVIAQKTPDEKKYNHLDFLWNKDVRSVVYDHILNLIGQYVKH